MKNNMLKNDTQRGKIVINTSNFITPFKKNNEVCADLATNETKNENLFSNPVFANKDIMNTSFSEILDPNKNFMIADFSKQDAAVYNLSGANLAGRNFMTADLKIKLPKQNAILRNRDFMTTNFDIQNKKYGKIGNKDFMTADFDIKAKEENINEVSKIAIAEIAKNEFENKKQSLETNSNKPSKGKFCRDAIAKYGSEIKLNLYKARCKYCGNYDKCQYI